MARRPVIVGHRANTAAWLKRYLKAGVDMVEVDVWHRNGVTGLGHILEDPGYATVRERIAHLLLSIHFRKPLGIEALPRLVPPGIGVWLDLKTRIPRACLSRLRVLTRGRRIVFSTRWHNWIPVIKEEVPEALVFASLDHRPAGAREMKAVQADGATLRFTYIDEELVEELHSAGLQLAAWTVNEESEMRRVIEMGVDYLITDLPWRALRILGGS
ncbi:glycerophosphodiester phosphodiesterase [Stetteria hydrogenophila]